MPAPGQNNQHATETKDWAEHLAMSNIISTASPVVPGGEGGEQAKKRGGHWEEISTAH